MTRGFILQASYRIEAGRPCRLDTKRKILNALQLRIDDQDRVFGETRGVAPARPVETRHSGLS